VVVEKGVVRMKQDPSGWLWLHVRNFVRPVKQLRWY
jgi:hypothetical protein